MIRVKPNTTPLSDDKNVIEKVAKQQPNLNEIFKEPTYDELKQALEAWLDPENQEGQDSTNASAPSSESNSVSNVNKVDDVSAAFDELF